MCDCGRKRPKARMNSKKPVQGPFVGQYGLVLVEYRGSAPGVRFWPSSLPGVRYPFGVERRQGYIDARDMGILVGQPRDFLAEAKSTFRIVNRGDSGQSHQAEAAKS